MIKKTLDTTLVYILSIAGLLCCCFGGLGLLLSGPAYLIANKQLKNSENYVGNKEAMETAKIVALVILIINTVFLIFTIYEISTADWNEVINKFEESYDIEMEKKSKVEMNQSI